MPAPVPARVTVRVKVGVKFAVTVLFAIMFIVHEEPEGALHPVQLTKVYPTAAAALRLTLLPDA